MTSPQFRYAALCLTSATLFGCATSSSPTVGSNVQYGDAKAVEQVTNEFGSTDLQTIAESMARSLAQNAAGFKTKPTGHDCRCQKQNQRIHRYQIDYRYHPHPVDEERHHALRHQHFGNAKSE